MLSDVLEPSLPPGRHVYDMALAHRVSQQQGAQQKVAPLPHWDDLLRMLPLLGIPTLLQDLCARHSLRDSS